MEILRLKPIYKETPWGGKLIKKFGYDDAGNHTGECWGISAHCHGDCEIISEPYKGKTLSWCYENHRELFGNLNDKEFPLLVKIIGAKEDLSIQVHPDNQYAREHEHGQQGKMECWYILDCDEKAEIVIGHYAKNKSELERMIMEGQWSQLIRTVPIKKGDFFQINPGCIHAIKGGTLLIEVQQNSDITYRVYDYERLYQGEKRELHVKQSIDCIQVPFEEIVPDRDKIFFENAICEPLIRCPAFTVDKYEINGEYCYEMKENFVNVSVIEGVGKINEEHIKKGEHFIIPEGKTKYIFKGNMTLIFSYRERDNKAST